MQTSRPLQECGPNVNHLPASQALCTPLEMFAGLLLQQFLQKKMARVDEYRGRGCACLICFCRIGCLPTHSKSEFCNLKGFLQNYHLLTSTSIIVDLVD
ncbi:hypothetical protein AVEN_177572-1 [Araneus ventricosus]|uniref:Uncharacterized protein n=1 Tax=Araneus ventricosus TaxID=182803 RepID=A0A4Y2MIT8_ARAVE|nr:hypothetical protein AVEN_177572-1 [Araneus ventricosus]